MMLLYLLSIWLSDSAIGREEKGREEMEREGMYNLGRIQYNLSLSRLNTSYCKHHLQHSTVPHSSNHTTHTTH